VLSNNFSLAEMVQPVWAGCISSSDDAWMRWLEEKGVTNFAWSSQARGFFTDRAGRGKMNDSELARSWYSEANFARRDRAIALGRKLGKDPIQNSARLCSGAEGPCHTADRAAFAFRAQPQPRRFLGYALPG
jgi:aryl-alcohol dehydrogenase-like predicted oxidoreductase